MNLLPDWREGIGRLLAVRRPPGDANGAVVGIAERRARHSLADGRPVAPRLVRQAGDGRRADERVAELALEADGRARHEAADGPGGVRGHRRHRADDQVARRFTVAGPLTGLQTRPHALTCIILSYILLYIYSMY